VFQIVSGVALHKPVLFIFILIRSIFSPKVWGKQFFRPTLSKNTHTRSATHALNKALLLTLPLQRVAEGKATLGAGAFFLFSPSPSQKNTFELRS